MRTWSVLCLVLLAAYQGEALAQEEPAGTADEVGGDVAATQEATSAPAEAAMSQAEAAGDAALEQAPQASAPEETTLPWAVEEDGFASLEELLATPIEVASNVGRKIREQPAVITLVTAEEIRASGARTLAEVLRMVPGFSLGQDSFGLVSWSARGIWAQEGRILLAIDGRIVNDASFGKIHLNGRFPVDSIERIEIIRGPGGVQFGQYAELGVVSIITKGADQYKASAAVSYGHMIGRELPGKFGDAYASLTAGDTLGDLGLSLAVAGGVGHQSEFPYVPREGLEDSMYDWSGHKLWSIDLSSTYKGAGLRLGAESFDFGWVSYFGLDDARYRTSMPNYYANLKHELKLLDSLTLKPFISFSRHKGMSMRVVDGYAYPRGAFYEVTNQRTKTGVSALYELSKDINVLAGFDYWYIQGTANEIGVPWESTDKSIYFRGKKSVAYSNVGAFLQAEAYTDVVNATAGVRVENHSAASKPSVIPRLGLSRVFGKAHAKAMYARAFRMGDIEHINTALVALTPETADFIELELGYQPTEALSLALNAFDVTIHDPITWYAYSADEKGVENANGELGSRGFEFEVRMRDYWGYLTLAYAYHQAHDNIPLQFRPAADEPAFIGAPRHTFSASSQFHITDSLDFNPRLWFASERYDTGRIGDVLQFEEKMPSTLLIDLWLTHKLPAGFAIGVGVLDLLNQKYAYLQAHDGLEAPLPGAGREVMVRLTQDLDLK